MVIVMYLWLTVRGKYVARNSIFSFQTFIYCIINLSLGMKMLVNLINILILNAWYFIKENLNGPAWLDYFSVDLVSTIDNWWLSGANFNEICTWYLISLSLWHLLFTWITYLLSKLSEVESLNFGSSPKQPTFRSFRVWYLFLISNNHT